MVVRCGSYDGIIVPLLRSKKSTRPQRCDDIFSVKKSPTPKQTACVDVEPLIDDACDVTCKIFGDHFHTTDELLALH